MKPTSKVSGAAIQRTSNSEFKVNLTITGVSQGESFDTLNARNYDGGYVQAQLPQIPFGPEGPVYAIKILGLELNATNSLAQPEAPAADNYKFPRDLSGIYRFWALTLNVPTANNIISSMYNPGSVTIETKDEEEADYEEEIAQNPWPTQIANAGKLYAKYPNLLWWTSEDNTGTSKSDLVAEFSLPLPYGFAYAEVLDGETFSHHEERNWDTDEMYTAQVRRGPSQSNMSQIQYSSILRS